MIIKNLKKYFTFEVQVSNKREKYLAHITHIHRQKSIIDYVSTNKQDNLKNFVYISYPAT